MALATGPIGAQTTTDPAPPATEVAYGKGEMESSSENLTGTDVRPQARSASGAPAPGTTGWTTPVEILPGTEMIAVTWDGARSAPDGTISIRSRDAAGWTAWETIVGAAPDEGGDGDSGRVGTGVVWLGSEGADGLELRVDTGPLVELTVLKMRYQEGEAEVVPVTPESRSTTTRAAAKPTIRARSAWASGGWKPNNSECGSPAPSVASSLKHAVVHHTASTNSYTAADVPKLIDGIYTFHTRAKPAGQAWCDIAYNFIVDKFGTIWQGRSGDVAKPVIGGHAGGFNTGSVGVTLLGQFQPGASPAAAQPTSAMLDSAARLIAWKLSLHGLDPHGSVRLTSGGNVKYPAGTQVTLPVINYHGQSGSTACPGANVIGKMPALRDAVKRYMGSGTTPPPTTNPPPTNPPPSGSWSPFASAEELVWKQYVDFRRGDPGTFADRQWWSTALKNGETNRNALVAALVRSDWVENNSLDSVRLYLTYFGRTPDSAGIRFWWGEVDKGRNLRSISSLFSGSPEFKQMYGNLTDEGFVRLVYRNVLGREGNAADIAWWTDQIRSGKDSRGGVMALFSKTKEFKDRSRTSVEVIAVHQIMLGRAISSSSHAEWVARVRNEGIGPLIGTLFSSSEYAGRVG